MDNNDIEIFGRKTFFIAPDAAMIPETYLEQFMTRGYEAYIIRDDAVCPLDQKVEAAISLHPGALIFFYVDADVETINWRGFAREMQKRYGGIVHFGAMIAKRPEADIRDQKKIEEFYAGELGLACGCLVLERRSKENFEKICAVLEKYRANGRRKSARAICDATSSMSFSVNGQRYRAKVIDVSISHFSCELPDDNAELGIYEKVRNSTLNVNGFIFTADAVLIMKRKKNDVNLCVYMFIKADDTPELEEATAKDLNHKIYDMISTVGKRNLRQAYDKMVKGE